MLRLHALALALALAACAGDAGPDSPVVGGPCSTDLDCDRRCTHSDDFGVGMCTLSCASDRDCTDFGRAFVCKNKKRRSGGDALVCRLP